LKNRVLVLEERAGVRVVRGLTTDAARSRRSPHAGSRLREAGIRSAATRSSPPEQLPRRGRQLRGSIDGFLTTMKVDEALVEYCVDVTASRETKSTDARS